MIVRTIRTSKILPGRQTIFDVLEEYLGKPPEGSVVAITSKIVSICEGRVIAADGIDKEELIVRESEYYLPKSEHGHRTIVHHSLISGAGIDESNAAGNNFILLPENPQKTANAIREYLVSKHRLNEIGVIITDSTSTPLRLGASGIVLAWSGFEALKDYRGKDDIFGRPFKVSRADIAGGLAAAAVLVMGEGAEQTPIALIEDIPFINFQDRSPTEEELGYMNYPLEEDLFAPLFIKMGWKKGGRASR